MKYWRKLGMTVAAAALVIPGAAAAKEPAAEKGAVYQAAQQNQQLIDNQVLIIKYKKAVPQSIHKKAGVRVLKRLPDLKYDVVQVPKTKKLPDVVKVYAERAEVTAITPSVQYKAFAASADPKASKMNHLTLLNMSKALSYAGKNSVTIAVVDSGVDFKHPDLKANLLKPYNAANPARNPVRDLHGTHVAGIIASVKNNGLGGYGMLPNAKILPIDVFNGSMAANDFTIAEGITYAVDQGADVINLSLGGFMPAPIVQEAIAYATEAGAVVVAAAGNESTDQYEYPAAYPGVISVGNVAGSKKLSDSSNYGASVDVVAPGESIYSTAYDAESGSKFDTLTGTSMAAPMVSAAAGLLKSKYPDLTSFEIEYILERTATDLGAKGYDLTYGNGLINPFSAIRFNVSKLPKRPEETAEAILKTAQTISSKQTFKGAFKSPGQLYWYKASLNAGQHVQTALTGSANYDYAMELYFVPEGEEPVFVKEINRTTAGGQEGSLYTAAEKGTLLIGVKDANGNYNASGSSAFTLTAEKRAPIKPDAAGAENPVAIASFPYTKNNFTLYSGEEDVPDSDFFTFTVDNPALLALSVSALPGVDSAINVYMKEETGELSLVTSGSNEPINKGETISFQAEPGITYQAEVTNSAFNEDIYLDSLSELLGANPLMFEEPFVGESAYPYTFKAEKRQIPADEDQLPDQHAPADEELSSKVLLQKAVAYPLGQKKQGYFQSEFDEDYYRFTASADGVYSFDIQKGSGQLPWMQLMELDKESGELIPIAGSGSETDLLMSLLGGGGSSKLNVALIKNHTYVLQVANDMSSASAEPYTITSKKVANLPAERDTDQGMLEEALDIKSGKAYQNYFIQSDDVDYFYFKNNGQPRVYTLDIAPSALTASQKAGIPFELRQGHIFAGSVIEDVNGDKMLDEDEAGRETPFGPDLLTMQIEPEVQTSFAAKEDAGYFIQVAPFLFLGPNLQPYTVKVGAAHSQFTDGDKKVTNHVPSKPLPLKTANGKFGARGYFNSGVSFGDVDHFVLNMSKAGTVSFAFAAGQNLDGVMEIYNAKGGLVASFDRYGKNDEELAALKLSKGTYYIELSELNGTASTAPYELIVKK